jgi:hypothetical protein
MELKAAMVTHGWCRGQRGAEQAQEWAWCGHRLMQASGNVLSWFIMSIESRGAHGSGDPYFFYMRVLDKFEPPWR